MFTETIDLTESAVRADRGSEPCPPLTRLEERVRDAGDFTPPPICLPFEADESDDQPTDADRHWWSDFSAWQAAWAALMPASAYPGTGQWSADHPCPDHHWAYSGLQDAIHIAPSIADQIDLAQFPTATTFAKRLFEIANLLLDVHDPVAKFAAEQLAKVAHRAEFFSATTPEEYDAHEAAQEEWAAEGGGR